jgi:hypothetical protein
MQKLISTPNFIHTPDHFRSFSPLSRNTITRISLNNFINLRFSGLFPASHKRWISFLDSWHAIKLMLEGANSCGIAWLVSDHNLLLFCGGSVRAFREFGWSRKYRPILLRGFWSGVEGVRFWCCRIFVVVHVFLCD